MQTILRPGPTEVNTLVLSASLARNRQRRYPHRVSTEEKPYVLDDQIGFVLRRVTQRHIAIFSEAIPELTTTQFATLAKLAELGSLSQNHLGRVTAMDAATIKGVVDRLRKQGLVGTTADPGDKRRLTVQMTPAGRQLFDRTVRLAARVSARTTAPLTAEEQEQIMALLLKLI